MAPFHSAHPWVREGGDALDMPLDISVLSNMCEFVKYSRLKQLALRALANTLDLEEIHDLRDQFDAMDVDRNDTITLEEIRHALQKDRPWSVKESRVLEILQAATRIKGSVETLLDEADTDGDRRISLPEFQILLHQASFGSRTNADRTQQRKWLKW